MLHRARQSRHGWIVRPTRGYGGKLSAPGDENGGPLTQMAWNELVDCLEIQGKENISGLCKDCIYEKQCLDQSWSSFLIISEHSFQVLSMQLEHVPLIDLIRFLILVWAQSKDLILGHSLCIKFIILSVHTSNNLFIAWKWASVPPLWRQPLLI